MKLPPKRKTDDPILASEWNQLIDAIAARTPHPGCGLTLTTTAGGFSYSGQPAASGPEASHPPFAVVAISKDDDEYLVTIKEGSVIEHQPVNAATPVVKFRTPKYGTTGLDATPRPQITMSIGDTLWCKYETDSTGAITGSPTVVVAAEEPTSTHYLPVTPGGSGTSGVFHVPLFMLDEDDDDVPFVTVYQQGDIEHYAQLWTGENIGDYGVGVFKKYDDTTGKFQFRKVHGTGPVSVSLNGEYIEIALSSGITGHVLIGIYPDQGGSGMPPWEGPSTAPDASLHWFKFVNGVLVATTHTTVAYVSGAWETRTVPTGYGDEIRRVIIPTDTGSMWY
jgi:hypothetical protein